MYDTILVPTDGSLAAAHAAAHARLVAARFDATVHLLSVYEREIAAGPFNPTGVPDEYVEGLEDEASSTVETTREDLGYEPVETAVRQGVAGEEILSYADEVDAGLVVMGTHGRSGLERYLLGSVAEHVTRRADAPVLTVRAERPAEEPGADDDTAADTADTAADEFPAPVPDEVDPYERLLVPTDGSACAELAVDHAVALGRAFDAAVDVVSVVDIRALTAQEETAYTGEVLDALREGHEESAQSVGDAFTDAALDAEVTVRDGIPSETILEFADERDTDLIVMGTHGRSGLSRFLIGSTAERVIRQADAPVVSVRSSDEE